MVLRHALLFSLLCILGAGVATAGDSLVLPAGSGRVRIYGGSARAGNYYDTRGNLKLFDSVQTSFVATTFGFTFDYGLTDALELDLDLPIGYFQVSSKSRFPTRSIFSPVYYGVGATYQITREAVATSISSMLKIPPGFHRGIYDDPEHPSFLSDGFFQVTTMLNARMIFDQIWLKGSVGYNWRDEEPLDEILYNLEVGFSRVEGTGVFVSVGGVQSTGDATMPARPFYAGASGDIEELLRRSGGTGRFSTIDRENYVAVSAGAFVNLTRQITLDGRYIVRLFGTNTLSLQGGYLGASYNF
jgi:hypothetical protein